MATDKPRFSVTFTEDSFNKIQQFKEENNISTQSKAVAQLVELAISNIEVESEKKISPSATEAAPGEDRITMEESNRLLVSLGLIEEGQDLSDDDLAFLEHIIGLLDAWFDKRT